MKFLDDIVDKAIGKAQQEHNPNEEIETKFLHKITVNFEKAKSIRSGNEDDIDDLETRWEDEYKMKKGGGLQWDTTFAHRSRQDRKIRPNSEDNFVFNSIMQMNANMTASTPDITMEGNNDSTKEIAEKITYMSKFNDKRNNFRSLWKKWVDDFNSYGPVIAMVEWDNDWMGGQGDQRWVGDIKLIRVNRKEFYPDPAIIDLEDRLQEGEFHARRFRKKLSYIRERWDLGKHVGEENNDDDMQDEGSEHNQAYVIEYWHRGKPKWVSAERKKELRDKADMFESDEMPNVYKAQEYRDMANGSVDGIHVAYIANGVFLEYIPYKHDDGLYPFVFKTCYYDENQQFGYGEIRNIKIPQAMHNKADEIEIEAMARQGLGGMYYTSGTLTAKQLEVVKKNNGKGGAWLEVGNINMLRDREGVQVPASIGNYKEHKQRMVETISQVTPIQQGMAPGANMPYKAIAELGARTDVRIKAKTEILEDFLTEVNKLRISRMAQYYTEDRYFRIKDSSGKIKDGTLNNREMMLSWIRDEEMDEATGQMIQKVEYFVPEFDINVKILDEKPTDRNYYTQTAFNLIGIQGMTMEDLWYTLEEGKFPPKDEVLKHLENQNVITQLTSTINQMPPESQEAFFMQLQQLMQGQQQMIQPQQVSTEGGM
jgi:hypothetical protein